MSACTYKVNICKYNMYPPITTYMKHLLRLVKSKEQTWFLQNLHPEGAGPTSFSALRAQSKNTWHGSGDS